MKSGKKKRSSSGKSGTYRYYPDQAWSCTGCGKCCTMWDIPVTKAEKERLEKLDIPGFDFRNEQYFIPMKKNSNLYLIRKKDDKCIFLDSDGLCIIHKLHGEAVKALACRLYPFHILNWEDNTVSASFRFDCTAVSNNHGKKITEQEKEIARFVPELAKSGRKSNAVFNNTLVIPLNNLRTLALSFRDILTTDSYPLSVRLYYAAVMAEFYAAPDNSGYIREMKREFREDTMTYLENRHDEFEYVIRNAPEPDRVIKMIFNYILTGYARVDEETAGGFFLSGRISRVDAILRFMTGTGSLNRISPAYPDTSGYPTLKTISESVLGWEAEQVLKRYIGVQLEAMHFCGNPGLNLTFEEGIRHLILFIPVTIAVAALHAAAGNRKRADNIPLPITGDDMIKAVRITDHTFYHSPFFTLRHVKKMIKWILHEKRFPSLLKLMEKESAETGS